MDAESSDSVPKAPGVGKGNPRFIEQAGSASGSVHGDSFLSWLLQFAKADARISFVIW